jgi:hypothetical protein
MKKLIKKIWTKYPISPHIEIIKDKNIKTIIKGTLKNGKYDKIK